MKLWLDDVRRMPDDYDVHVRTERDAILALKAWDDVSCVSLDCDLGLGGRGYGVALWITKQWDFDRLTRLRVICHSSNPVERDAVNLLLARARERIEK